MWVIVYEDYGQTWKWQVSPLLTSHQTSAKLQGKGGDVFHGPGKGNETVEYLLSFCLTCEACIKVSQIERKRIPGRGDIYGV